MNPSLPTFREPTAFEKLFNRSFGFLVGLGLGLLISIFSKFADANLAKLFSTPVDLLELQGQALSGCSSWTNAVGAQC